MVSWIGMIVHCWLAYLIFRRFYPQLDPIFRLCSQHYRSMGSCICPVKNEQPNSEPTRAADAGNGSRTGHTSVTITGNHQYAGSRPDPEATRIANCNSSRDNQVDIPQQGRHSHSSLNHKHYHTRNGQAVIDSLVLETLQLIRTLIDT